MAYLHLWPEVPVKIKLLYPDAKLPVYMSEDAAGADVCAYLDQAILYAEWWQDYGERAGLPQVAVSAHLHPRGTLVIPLGFAIEIPRGFVLVAKGRSGHAKEGIEAHQAWIDPDYRGQCAMIVHGGPEGVRIEHGERIGQIAIVPCFRPAGGFQVVDELSETKRGAGGFGSTKK